MSMRTKRNSLTDVCNTLYDAEISPEQGASKIVKISQHVAKLCQKLKWLGFFLEHGVYVDAAGIHVFVVQFIMSGWTLE